jgi:transporter family protein
MQMWLPAALMALMSFGLWGLFSKIAITYIDTKSALVFQTAGVLIVGLITLSMLNFKPATEIKGVGFGLLTGIAYGVGCLFYLTAADKGKLTTVVTLTALYPIVTITLSYFILQETVSIKQCIGILLALTSIFLMA